MKTTIILLLLYIPASVFAQLQLTNTGNLQLHPGAEMALYGNFSNSGTFVDGGQAMRFNGTSAQSVAGSSVTTFSRLFINNTAGVTLNQSVNVSTVLTLSNGALTLNSQLLTVQSGATAAIVRTNGYIVSEQPNNQGRLRWNIGTTTGAHIFPFGKATGEYIPFTVNLTAGNIGNVTLATYPTALDNTPYPTTPNAVTTMADSSGTDNSGNTVDRFWQIDKDGPTGTATLTFTATPAEMGAIMYVIRARRWNTATQAWETPLPGQTFTATSVTVPGVTAFSPWVMAGAVIPLPIELVSFAAQVNERREVDLAWITASEINNDYFTVERSQDLMHFETVLTRAGAGNSNQLLHYADVDPNPHEGVSYYRLKQTDYDGSFSYSPPISVNLSGEDVFRVTVFPNPATADNVHVSISGITGPSAIIKITDMAGRTRSVQQIATGGMDAMLYKLPAEQLAAGIYVITVSNGPHEATAKVVIR